MNRPAIKAPVGGSRDFKLLPAGAHFSCCVMVVDIGMQEGFNGKPQHKVYLKFEVPDERVEYTKDDVQHEGPMTIGTTYTLSMHEKANLRKDLENWRGASFTDIEAAEFDIGALVGKCCQVMVTHNKKGDKTYANLTGIMGLAKEQKARAKDLRTENPLIVYSVSAPDIETYNSLPEWLREKIDGRIQSDAKETTREPATSTEGWDDDIPF